MAARIGTISLQHVRRPLGVLAVKVLGAAEHAVWPLIVDRGPLAVTLAQREVSAHELRPDLYPAGFVFPSNEAVEDAA